MFYPILLITFNRPEHTRRTLEALQKNAYASDSDLYVYVDGPRSCNIEKDTKAIAEVEKVILSENWCKSVTLRKSEFNRGCRDAVIYAISDMLKTFDAVIILEDDIITSPAFLSYMNKALDFYKERKSVFSISGHSHSPEKFQVPSDYPYDVFASPRLFNWGWATWADRWNQADWTMGYYDDFMCKPYEKQAFSRGGDDMIPMLVDEKMGRSSAWDIQFAFTHFANHAVSIVPCESYTANIGLDGSGTHCGNSKHSLVDMESLNQRMDPILLDRLYFDSRIINLLHNAFSKKKRPLWKKACNFIARQIGKKPIFVLKSKVFA